ncbi:hypothetical protein [Pontivivens ytuae]|uniref:hypothetical protein n=1 Tax=Pontivivens ytuae TaxID=2789856 RepID=UPI001E2A464A|nr:hypothetical protein [Pontivivens ytuae]
MSDDTDAARVRLAARAEAARVLYDSLTRALTGRIQFLEGGTVDSAQAKDVASELTQHRKALLALIENEVKLDGSPADGAAAPLDLDAARDELRARILKLRNRRGDRGAAGGAQ